MSRDAHDRPVQPLECVFVDPSRDLTRHPTRSRVLMNDEQLVGLAHGGGDRFVIHREQRTQIQHFDRCAVLPLDLLGGIERLPHHGRPRHDGEVGSLAGNTRLADRREDLFGIRQILFDPPIEEFVLEVQHWIVIADRSLDQPLGIPCGRRTHELEPGCVEEPSLWVLRVERPATDVSSRGSAHHDGRGEPRSIPCGSNVVGQDVVCACDEIHELHLGDRAEAHVGGAGSGPHNSRLAYRRVDYPRLAEAVLKAVGDLERTAVPSDVLTQHEHGLVALHLLQHSLAQCLEVGDLRHRASGTTARRLAPGTRSLGRGPSHPRPAPGRFRNRSLSAPAPDPRV